MDAKIVNSRKDQSPNVHERYQTVFQKRIKKIANPNTGSESMQSGHRNGIWHKKICNAINKNQGMIQDGRNGTIKSIKKNENAQRKWNVQILGNSRSRYYQRRGNKEN